jgi:N6-L-threonylcarbamoyladenine synthase
VGLSREADQGRGEGSRRTDFGAGCAPHPTLSHKGRWLLPHPATHTLVVAGGVAANATLRAALANAAARHGFTLVAPPLKLCGDNAVMVAWAGIERLRLGLADPLDHAPRPRWPLTDLAA